MAKSNNVLVYKYGGDKANQNHFISTATGKISRTGKKGVKPSNKNVGDDVLIISQTDDNRYMITWGIYKGLDQNLSDVWQDMDAHYDRQAIEQFDPIKTLLLSKDDFFDGAVIGPGTYNDNGKNASTWLSMIHSAGN